MINVSSYKVENVPNTVYYIPNFISEADEQDILKNVYTVPKPKWTCLKNRRLQDWGGVPHKNGMITEDIPRWLQGVMKNVSDLGIYGDKTANHVLINEYLPGQGIMPHLDGPLFYPTIATVSCGSHTVLEFVERDSRISLCNLLLEQRSLIVLQNEMYTDYMHSISEITDDLVSDSLANLSICHGEQIKCNYGKHIPRNTRISLTIRNVPKVCKLKVFK